jgi:hypothetical protein
MNHLAAQRPKHAVPVAMAAAATGGGPGGAGGISAEDLRAFQEWKAMAQAATAPPAKEDEEDGWDDYEYELGAVALPLKEMTEGLGFAAVATRTETEKARAKKKPRSEVALGPRAGVAAGQQSGAVGTARLAPPVDVVAVEALKARRDKAAAKERLTKLPDHGRHVAPQGLHRLPRGFETRPPVPAQVVQTQGESGRSALAPQGASIVRAPVGRPVVGVAKPNREGDIGRGLESFACDGGPLRDSVWVDLGVLLELAKRAELGIQDLALPTKARLIPEPLSADTNPVSGQVQAGTATKG